MDTIEYKDLYPTEVQRMYCSKCSANLRLVYEDFEKVVSNISLKMTALPQLRCDACDCTYLPERTRFAIIRNFEEALKQGVSEVTINRKKIKEDFGFAKVGFIYDPDDYYYIPGLVREWDRGFLTPVFFNRRVLIKFDHSEDYELKFASRTYGTIYTDQDYISFGINSNNNVVMWLGDIAKLPESEQFYLRSENVVSDHDIGSEFYDGQIECKFTDLTPEDNLISTRSAFLEAVYKRFGLSLSHLDEETLSAIVDFYPPTEFTNREQQRLSVLICQICIESLDSKGLKNLLSARNIDSKNFGSIKLLQLLLETDYPSENVASVLSALYVAYDLRIANAHLTSKERAIEIMSTVKERLNLQPDDGFPNVYSALVDSLSVLFRSLETIVSNPNESESA
jgi:hypothetical protein